jgi:hypothetical protein
VLTVHAEMSVLVFQLLSIFVSFQAEETNVVAAQAEIFI